MISIIVCSSSPELFHQFEKNVAETIGCSYELLSKDNRFNSRGICTVYNELAQQAAGDVLCFVHEDVSFDTNNWGEILLNKLQDPEVGVIGFAGALNVSGKPYWFDKTAGQYYYVQRLRNGDLFYDFTKEPRKVSYQRVSVLDGMFLSCRKEVWQANKFDTLNFSEFHIYDIDFSFQIAHRYHNFICKEIVINHYSLGSLSEEYYVGLMKFYEKWKSDLPLLLNEENLMSSLLKYQLIMELVEKVSLNRSFVLKYFRCIDEIDSLKNYLFVEFSLMKLFIKRLLYRKRKSNAKL